MNFLSFFKKKEIKEVLTPQVKTKVPLSSLKEGQVIELLPGTILQHYRPKYSPETPTFIVVKKINQRVSRNRHGSYNTLIKVKASDGNIYNLKGYKDTKVLKVS